MIVKINGKRIEIGKALTFYVEKKIFDLFSKYSIHSINSTVTFSKIGHEFLCDTHTLMTSGMIALSKGKSSDIYASYDQALNKIEKQFRRYKRRLKNHNNERKEPIEYINEPSYILSNTNDDTDINEKESLQPIIIAEMETKISTLSVGEAVMQLELMGNQMLLFRNSSHQGINLVYLRNDGNIGWIDPRNIK